MKPRLIIVLVLVLLASAVVTLEFQLRYIQMEFQATTDVTDELNFAFSSSSHQAKPAAQTIPAPKTKQ